MSDVVIPRRAARSPLFAALRRALALAGTSVQSGAPGTDELVDMRREFRIDRRQVLKGIGGVAGVAAAGLVLPKSLVAQGIGPRIVVVGAGLAGLTITHRLAEAGHSVTLYEANERTGGRMFSLTGNRLGDGVVAELGASFINSDHEDTLALVREFKLDIEDANDLPAGVKPGETFFIGGRHYNDDEITAALKPFARRVLDDRAAAEASEEALANFDGMSCAAYLDRLGMTGWLRTLMDTALGQEMGLEPDSLSAMYLVGLLQVDPAAGEKGLFDSDQRFQIKGGNQALPDALVLRHAARLRRGHKLVQVAPRGTGYRLAFARRGAATVEVNADIVVLALPFSVLRHVELRLPLSREQRVAMRDLGYGTNSKVLVGMTGRPWLGQGFSGSSVTELPYQTGWEDHGVRERAHGSYTFFAGGERGRAYRTGSAEEQARRLVSGLDRAFPGSAAAFTGRASRMIWPTNPYMLGSYSAFKPGQWELPSLFEEPMGRVFFAGEHLSSAYSGFMNGAAESARVVTAAVLEAVK